ncbi:unnamed protein product [Closterium sp. NIES-54]
MTESQDVVGVATGIGAAVIARESLATGMGAVTPSLRESLPTGIGAGTPSLRAILPPGIGAAVIPRESLATGIDEILGRENPPNGPPLLRCYARRLPPCLAQRNAAGVGDGMKLEWVGEDEDAWEEEEGEGVCKGTIGKKRGCVGKARGLNELLSVSGEERRKGSKRAGEEDKVRDRGEGKVKEGIEKGKEMAREGKVEKEEGGKGKMKKDERGEGGHESLHACDECGKDFATWSKLNYHVATHTKPFVCQHCQKGFARKVSLQDHLFVHNPDSPKHPCPHCSSVFRRLRDMRSHAKEKHGEDWESRCRVVTVSGGEKESGARIKKVHRGEKGMRAHGGVVGRHGGEKKADFVSGDEGRREEEREDEGKRGEERERDKKGEDRDEEERMGEEMQEEARREEERREEATREEGRREEARREEERKEEERREEERKEEERREEERKEAVRREEERKEEARREEERKEAARREEERKEAARREEERKEEARREEERKEEARGEEERKEAARREEERKEEARREEERREEARRQEGEKKTSFVMGKEGRRGEERGGKWRSGGERYDKEGTPVSLSSGEVGVGRAVVPLQGVGSSVGGGRATGGGASESLDLIFMGPPVALPVMQHPCPSRAPSAWRFLLVARPRRVAVSARRAPPARDGVLPVARLQRATVFCPSRGGPVAVLPVVPAARFLLPLLLRVQQFGGGGGGGGGGGDAGVAVGGGCTSSAPLLCFITKPAAPPLRLYLPPLAAPTAAAVSARRLVRPARPRPPHKIAHLAPPPFSALSLLRVQQFGGRGRWCKGEVAAPPCLLCFTAAPAPVGGRVE